VFYGGLAYLPFGVHDFDISRESFMKKIVLAATVALTAMSAHADVGGFVGITYAFGSSSGFGFTLQATSSRHEDRGVAAVGVSYYPSAGKFGIPVGVGYQGKHAAGILSYDFLLNAPAVSGGYVDTRTDSQPAPAPLPPV
jgi:hypothetical protein